MKTSHPEVRHGLTAGFLFGIVAVSFVLISTFTNISRATWVTLHNVQGVLLVAFCLSAGFWAAHRTGRWSAAVVASTVACVLAAFLELAAQGIVAYGFTDYLRQYPFEYYDFISSGAPTLKAYLYSGKGIYDYTWTAGVCLLFGVVFGAVVGGVAGLIRRACGRFAIRPFSVLSV